MTKFNLPDDLYSYQVEDSNKMASVEPYKDFTPEEIKILLDSYEGIGKAKPNWGIPLEDDREESIARIEGEAPDLGEDTSPYRNDPSYVRCEICGRYFKIIHILHLRTHGITQEEYNSLFPGKPTCSENLSKQQSLSHIGLPRSEETCKLLSESNYRRWADPKTRIEWSMALRESMSSPEFRERRAEISKENWKDPEYVEKTMKGKCGATRHIQEPNVEEIQFWFWVHTFRPNSIIYNKEYIPIARLTPDFLVIGEKKVIEYFGEYWHAPDLGGPGIEAPSKEEYIRRYEEAGYKCLIIWSYDVYLPETQKRIEEFLDDKV